MVSFRIRRLEHFGRTLPEKSCRLAGYAETAGFLRYTRQQRHIDFLYVSAPLCFSQLRTGQCGGQWPGTDHPRQSQSHLGDDAHDQYRSGLRVVCPSFKWFCGCIQQADDRYPDFIAGTVRARHFCCPQPKCRQGTQPGYRFRYQLVRSYRQYDLFSWLPHGICPQ